MKRVSILALLLFLSTAALAQMADASFTVGGSFVSDVKQTFVPAAGPSITSSIQSDHHIFLEGALSLRMFSAGVASLHVEVPAAGIPSQSVTLAGLSGAVDHLSSVFVTPGLKLKLLPAAGVSPWASVGGGWAHYALDSGGTANKGALEYGGGLDFKTKLPALGFRAEVRDFVTTDPTSLFTGGPSFTPQSGLHHHNILAGGGVVLRF